MSRFRLLPSLLLLVLIGCGKKSAEPALDTFTSVPVHAFDSLLAPDRVVMLHPDSADAVGFAASVAVTPTQLYVADAMQANVKVFDPTSGALQKTLGRAGDGPGEFRAPVALTRLADGRLVVYDMTRSILSIWDSLGTFEREHLLPGAFTTLLPIPGTDLILSGGWFSAPDKPPFDKEGRRPMAHEIGIADARVTASYQPFKGSGHKWASTFSTPSATLVGNVVVAGAMATNIIYFHDRGTGREWSAQIGAPWYHRPNWPTEGLSGKGVVDRMNKWQRDQEMLVGLFPLSESQFLAQFQGNDADGSRQYSYIVADTAGHSLMSSGRTPVQILDVRDGVAWGIEADNDNGETILHRYTLRR